MNEYELKLAMENYKTALIELERDITPEEEKILELMGKEGFLYDDK